MFIEKYFIVLQLEISSGDLIMSKKVLFILAFVSISVGVFATEYSDATPIDSVSRSTGDLCSIEKKIETNSRVDAFSAIGGMLYNTSANSHEVRIDNLPKSFLVVRVRFANNQTAIYKIRHN